MNRFTLILPLLIFLHSCQSNQENEKENQFLSDTTIITDAYPPIENETVISVMEGLKVCTTSDTIPTLPPCSHDYFRVFKLGPEATYDEGFILEMKAGLFGTPVKQTLIIKKGFNKYQIINQYLGFLVELRTSENGYYDLLMGYKDLDIGIVAIKHIFDGAKYEPVEVEELNGYFIKDELKDSINHLFIDNFNAGY